MMMDVTVKPVGHLTWSAYVDNNLLCTSRTPLLSAARKLLQLGVPPQTELRMLHDGNSVVAMTTTVGQAAKLTVEERSGGNGPRFAAYEPMSDKMPFAGVRVGSNLAVLDSGVPPE
jgi:hypothetical protein